MSRELVPYTIKRFKGINVWKSFVNSVPDEATDCLNVIPSSSGAVEKMRVPVDLTTAINGSPVRFRQYENSNSGLRQVIAQFGRYLYAFDTAWTATLIDSDALNANALFDFVESNNLFFGANGSRNFKWDGTTVTQWGIAAPSAAPNVNAAPAKGATPVNINAVASTVATAGGSGRTSDLVTFFTTTPHGCSVGDLIQVAGVTPDSFNGFFIVEDVPTASSIDYHQVGIDENVTVAGTILRAQGSGIYRNGNEVTVTTAANHGLLPGQQIVIAGVTDASFDGNVQIDSVPAANQFTYPQNGVVAISGSGTETPATAPIFSHGGRSYRISFGKLSTGHVGNASDISASTGNLNGTLNVTVTGVPPTDTQVDTAILWSTEDGGSDYYFNQQINIAALQAPVFQDTIMDGDLNSALIAPLINNPPPLGNFTDKWQGRVIIFDLVGNAQGFAYSGYERILIGRPEESFPPNNLLRLQIGADALQGGGAVSNGYVLFSRSAREKMDSMYILMGQLQDITIDAPVQLTTFLRPLPWKIGCFSRYSVVSTPRGLVWLASDKTIQLYNGQNPPECLSTNINPLLRLITAGTEGNIRATYFNYLEREWYVLVCAINGSQVNNQILIVDLDPNPELNAGIFRSDIGADEIGIVDDANDQSQLIIAAQGILKQFVALSDTWYGYSDPVTSTSGTLRAYWRSGVHGNESPNTVKMFRWSHIVRNSHSADFYVQTHVIKEDDEFQFPELLPKTRLEDNGRFSINDKGRRLVHHVQFPDIDQSANLIEMTTNYIPLAER